MLRDHKFLSGPMSSILILSSNIFKIRKEVSSSLEVPQFPNLTASANLDLLTDFLHGNFSFV